MKKVLLFSLALMGLVCRLQAQTCNATSFDVDLSASIDTTVTFQSTRNGDCCTGTNCIRFNLKLNPACSYVNFNVQNPAPPGNAAYYQIDCGPPTSLGTPLCIVGKTSVVISFCKPGNDNPIYTITAAGALKGSEDITVREGCTGAMNVAGLQPATINWTSIYPGPEGSYNSWLNCTSGCTSVSVLPGTGAPAYVDYKVSGYRVCGPLVNDTIRVYTTPQIAVSISPDNPSVCAGGSSSLTLTATASGGDEPYQFLWSNGQSGNSITVNTGNTYSVSVTDTRNCLPAKASVLVSITPLPLAPTLSSNGPVCAGASLQLFASLVAGASYSWTGPNGFVSSLQNPVIANVSSADAGTYSVTVTVGQCTSLPATISVNVKSVPAPPVAGTNAPVCGGQNLDLSASNIPGAAYSWTGPNGFSSSGQNPTINNANPSHSGSYSVTATVNGCASGPATILATVNALPPAPVVNVTTPVCQGAAVSFTVADITDASFSWAGPMGFSSSMQNPVITNAGVSASGTYSVKATVNGCTGPSSPVAVVVHPIPPTPSLSSNSPVCEGADLNLSASFINGAGYSWTGPNGFSSTAQNPIIKAAAVAATGNYSVVVTVNGCSSAATSLQAIVYAIPAAPLISGETTVCEGGTLSLSASTIASASYLWQGPNGFTSTAQNLSLANAVPLQSGAYSVSVKVNGCTGPGSSANVQINKLPLSPTIVSNSPVCSGTPLAFSVQPLAGAIYNWTGPDGFSSASQNPIIANAGLQHSGDYYLSVFVNGCQSVSPSSAAVLVKQTPAAPVLANNSPICEGSNLQLSASGTPGGIFNWTGPNGFSSLVQNPVLPNASSAESGSYSATVTFNGCIGPAAFTSAVIDRVIRINAGPDQVICSNLAGVSLAASSSNGSGAWTSDGSGVFSNASDLKGIYYPSPADKNTSALTLHFTSVNNGSCPASSASTTIRFAPMPSASAGPDQTVCANNANVFLNGQYTNATGGTWISSGTGSFQPSAVVANATYIPGAKEKTEGSVALTWKSTGNGPCPAATDTMIVVIRQPPSINTGGSWYAYEDKSVVLKPVVTGSGLAYSWSPAVFLNSDTVGQPVCTPQSNINYKLTAKDEGGCVASADIAVKLIRNPVIPNVFSPNGDGINDTWQVKNLSLYTDCVVDIYNRYGQVVYRSTGYARDWDGRSGGSALPAGTYYYIIDLKTGAKPFSGFVDIVR